MGYCEVLKLLRSLNEFRYERIGCKGNELRLDVQSRKKSQSGLDPCSTQDSPPTR